MTFIIVMRALPKIEITVSLKELTPDTVTSTVRVDMTSLEDKWLQILVNIGNNSCFVFFHLL
jgi:hypothetical protein